jgi:septal ring factor EnvC (AmiA/AmiB activator)
MELTRLQEDLKLTTGRLNTSTGQAADLLQQLKSVQAENASLMSQLALSQGRDTEAAAAHKALQEALDGMRSELKRWAGPCCRQLTPVHMINAGWQARQPPPRWQHLA